MTRWSWRGVLALVAVLAIGAQLDQASQSRPALSVLVPAPFRSSAQSPTALLALAAGDGRRARIEAQRLVRRRPLPAEHLFTLAMAEMQSGHSRAFATAFRAASTRGWRFAPLQLTAAQAALLSGDLEGAANRVAALWAGGPGNPALVGLTKTLLEQPGGPEAFAVPLAQTRVWSNTFLRRAPSLAANPAVLAAVVAARRRGAQFDCAALTRFVAELEKRGEPVPVDKIACE